MNHALSAYLHLCDRTGELCDELDDEFAYCRCFTPTAEILALQDAIAVRLDRARGAP